MKKTIIMILAAMLFAAATMAEDKIITAEDVARVLYINEDGQAEFAYQTGYDYEYVIQDNSNPKSAFWKAFFATDFESGLRDVNQTATVTYIEKETQLDVSFDGTVEFINFASYETGQKEIYSEEYYAYVEAYERTKEFKDLISNIIRFLLGGYWE